MSAAISGSAGLKAMAGAAMENKTSIAATIFNIGVLPDL
jgi:hypothetical protein